MEEIKLEENINNTSNNNSSKIKLFVIVLVIVSIVGVIAWAIFSMDNYLTLENFNKIQTGMTYEQVVQVLDGHEGVLDTEASSNGYSLAYYSWSDASGLKVIVVCFENGKVYTKTQLGLS